MLFLAAASLAAADADKPLARGDRNSMLAHEQLLAKAKQGRIDVYFLGDSITRRWGGTDYPQFLEHWKQSFHGWNAANFGWGGDSTRNILWRLENGELDGVKPKVIVLLAGTNNLGKTPAPDAEDDVVRGLKAIIAQCKKRAPGAVILLHAIFPRNDSDASNAVIQRINKRLPAFADGRSVRFIDITSLLADENGVLREGVSVDKLHLSLKGYQLWGEALRPHLQSILGSPAPVDHAPPPTGDPSAAK